MNATLGIYNNHDLAVEAVSKLKDSGYPVSQLSILGKTETEVLDEDMRVTPKYPLKLGALGATTVLGTTLGVLAGVGIFAIPGLGFLFGAGAVVGAIAGLDFGLMGGVLASLLTNIGVKDENLEKYHSALAQGKYVVIAHGNEEEVNNARNLLHEHGTHEDVEVH